MACNISVKGIMVPIITPIDENENIDEVKLRKQVNYVISGGVDGILAFGSNGEFYMLEEEDMKKGFEIIKNEAGGRVPVFFGIGAVSTKKCVRLAKLAKELGATGISVLQPMFLKPTEAELFSHFKTIAEAVPGLPMMLYNNPGRTGYTMSAGLVGRLAKEVENIIGMKDSSGDITQLSEYIRVTANTGFSVMGGKDTMIYPALAMGACGAVCTTANIFPELVCEIYDKYEAGDREASLAAQYKLNPVRLSMDKASFPVATKDMANLKGLDVGLPFMPNKASEGAVLEAMRKEMEKAGII